MNTIWLIVALVLLFGGCGLLATGEPLVGIILIIVAFVLDVSRRGRLRAAADQRRHEEMVAAMREKHE